MQPLRQKLAKFALHHLVQNGIIALFIAVASLARLKGLTIGTVIVFGLPPLYAALCTRARFSRKTRLVAWSFLCAIGVGAIVTPVLQRIPNLVPAHPELGPSDFLMILWYGTVYLIWLTGVMPLYVFVGNLRAHKRGLPIQINPAICYLGLFTFGLWWFAWLSLGLRVILWKLGFLQAGEIFGLV